MIIFMSIALGVSCLVLVFVAELTAIIGASMEPSLKDKDMVIINKLLYRFRKPRRFEVVALKFGQRKKEYLIKRIIAMPGENIQIKKGYIYVNDTKLDEAFGLKKIKNGGIATKKIKLGRDEYFVLGDNRNNSLDSRNRDIGAIKQSRIIGKAWIKIWRFW